MSLTTDRHLFVAHALREYTAMLVKNPSAVSREQAQTLDRALRSCPAITDIDVVWVLWRAVGEPLGWMTDGELVFKGRQYRYPSGSVPRD